MNLDMVSFYQSSLYLSFRISQPVSREWAVGVLQQMDFFSPQDRWVGPYPKQPPLGSWQAAPPPGSAPGNPHAQ